MSSEALLHRFFTRGAHQILPSEEKFRELLASGKKLKFYLGADPSRPDLHIGHAVSLRRMRLLQELGYEIIFLIGDFTGRIGDPTGKDAARKQMTEEEVMENAKTYEQQIRKIFDFDGENPAKILFNSKWNQKLDYADLIQLASKFTVQQLIERDMYQDRLKAGKPIFLHEFFYPLMQGYDSVAMEVDGEFGGTDQLFNMMAGRTLLKEMRGKEKFVITSELLPGTDGRKMSKSYDNYIGLHDEPNQMYGRCMSIADELIIQYFTLCTDLSDEEITIFQQELKDGKNPRDLKMRLAREIVTLYHDESAATSAEQGFVQQFQQGGMPEEIEEVVLLPGEYTLPDLLLELSLVETKGEAKRLVKQGGVKLDGEKVAGDPNQLVRVKAGLIVQVGKLRYKKVSY